MAKKDLMKQIKEMEDKSRKAAMKMNPQPVMPVAQDASKVDFDSWYYLRSSKIPAHHMKEIVKADFKARQVSEFETMEVFDKALESYGVKIK